MVKSVCYVLQYNKLCHVLQTFWVFTFKLINGSDFKYFHISCISSFHVNCTFPSLLWLHWISSGFIVLVVGTLCDAV